MRRRGLRRLPPFKDYLFRAAVLFSITSVALTFVIVTYRPPAPNHRQGEQANANQENVQSKSFGERLLDDPTAFFTMVLAGLTFVLAGVSSLQIYFLLSADRTTRLAARAAVKSAEVATRTVESIESTAEKQLRSYVVLKPFWHKPETNVITGLIQEWSFRCVWHNVGSTPTKHMVTRVGFVRKFSFEELNFAEEMKGKLRGHPGRLFLGPGNEAASEKFTVSIDEMIAVTMGSMRIYLWGCANYSDTFTKTSRHRTEFFAKIVVIGDPRSKDCGIGYQLYGPFNGIDDECYGQPEPYDPEFLS